MKLSYFSEQTLKKDNSRIGKYARVCFSKLGVISLNGTAAKLIGISAGDKLSLARDQDSPKDWYFFKDAANGFPVRSAYNGKGVIFNHKALVRKFIDANDLKQNASHQFLIAGQKTTWGKVDYFGILIP